MISPEREAYVRTLAASGKFSQREIAAKAGVSRGTVQVIASGRRIDRHAVRTADGRLVWEPEEPERWAWCYGCGAKVLQPCLACFVRSFRSVRDVFGGKR